MPSESSFVRCIVAPLRRLAALGVLAAAVTALAAGARADETTEAVAAMFKGGAAVTVDAPVGDPPIWPIRRDGRIIAWAGRSAQLVGSLGYAGRPIDVLVAIDGEARVAGAHLLEQSEPILVLGIAPAELDRYVRGFAGAELRPRMETLVQQRQLPDAVSGATMSSGVIRDAVLRTGRLIAQRAGLFGAPLAATADRSRNERLDWPALVRARALARLAVSFAEARTALPAGASVPDGEGLFAEVVVALGSVPAIGRSLIGAAEYDRLTAELGAADDLLIVAGNGLYSFKGTEWRRSGLFDRIELVQGERTLRLSAAGHLRLDAFAAAGAPPFREIAAIRVPAEAGLRSAELFRLDLVVTREVAGAPVAARFGVDYRLPSAFAVAPAAVGGAPPEEPLWRLNWQAKRLHVAAVVAMLAVLLVVLFAWGPLVRRPVLYLRFRLAFLTITLVGLGWIAGGQLSIVHVVAFLHSLLTGFRWETFLLDPLAFVLWWFVAVGLLFWGRGVFCGWLCPFGALQELGNAAAKRLGVRQIEVPFELHQRLRSLKYVLFLGIVGLSLQSLPLAFRAAEVEPFKTAISLRFLRDWPFVAYALGLLVAGIFVERFFCRYLCPLGAGLAIPAKLRIFDWLARRPQCGRECRLCNAKCPVQAIHPIGQIDPNECIYCLRCQVIMYDPETCIPLKQRARRRAGKPAEPEPPSGLAPGRLVD